MIVFNRELNSKVRFNAVLDVTLSDAIPSDGGGAHVLNDTASGEDYQNDVLISGIIYLLFLDGVQFTQVDSEDDLDPLQKQFWLDTGTGTVEFSYNIDDPVAITIFYSSPGATALPGAEPVTLQEVKDYCKIDTGSTDDTILTYLITTAREQCEDFTGISIVNRTVTTVLNNTCGGIFLPYGPVISLTSIKDCNGDDIPTDNYILSGLYFKQLVTPWWDRMTLIYTAGYGIPPARIKTAILQQVFYLYENRGESAIVSRGVIVDETLSPQAKSTLQRLRRVG